MTNHVSEWLNTYIDDELSGFESIRVEEHLAVCESCQQELSELINVKEWTRETFEFEPVPNFLDARIMEEIEQLKKAGRQLEIGFGLIAVALLALFVSIHSYFNHGMKVIVACYRILHSLVIALPGFAGFPVFLSSTIIGSGILLVVLTLPILWRLLRSMSVDDRRGWQ